MTTTLDIFALVLGAIALLLAVAIVIGRKRNE